MKAKVTVTGWAGTGKSTLGRAVAARFGLAHYSAGDYYREIARKRGISLGELEQATRGDPSVDYEVDGRTTELGRTQDRFVFDGRLAWNCIPDSLKILLVCPDEVRFARIAERDGIAISVAREETLAREEAIRDRFGRFYIGLGRFDDPKRFDLVIDTSVTAAEEALGLVARRLS